MQRIGKYEIIEKIGVGGLADVYLARTIEPPPYGLVALKRLRRKWRGRQDLTQLFLTEADIGRLLSHPNIVRVFEAVFDESDTLTIIMEFLGGKDLCDVLGRVGADQLMAYEVSIHIVRGLLVGLHYAHELTSPTGMCLDLVHRDVTPDNVFILFDGAIKLSDFGIAHMNALDGSAANSGSFGKIPYMSPEQLLEKAIDRRSDIHAAGVILYELLTGRHPFRDDEKMSDSKLIERIIHGRHQRASTLIPSIPKSLEAVIEKALAPVPEQRFSTALEMELALLPFYRHNANWGPIIGGMMRQLYPGEYAAYRQACQTDST